MKKQASSGQFRQGDVFLMRAKVDTTKHVDVPRDRGAVVLAHGEVTGHRHVFRDPGVCMLSLEGVSDRVVTLMRVADLTHEEHTAIPVPPGTYTVRIQREYDENEHSRAVED